MLEANGVEREDRVATLLPSLPETAAVFLGTYKRGAILLSMSVLYGDDGIQHRLSDSGAKVRRDRHRRTATGSPTGWSRRCSCSART